MELYFKILVLECVVFYAGMLYHKWLIRLRDNNSFFEEKYREEKKEGKIIDIDKKILINKYNRTEDEEFDISESNP